MSQIVTDEEVALALIDQVKRAVPEGGNERNVATFVTLPMYQAWARGVVDMKKKHPPAENPNIGPIAICGSQTFVMNIDGMYAFSRPI